MKGSRSQYRSGFDPNQIPGCQLWLDAADRNTLTLSGSNVIQWRDKSGNVNNALQSTLSNAPTLSGSSISFNGSQWFTTPVSSAPTAESLFIVLNTTSNATTDIFSGTAVGYREVLLYLSNLYVGRYGAAPAGTNGGAIATNTLLQFSYQYTTTNVTYSVNGTQTGSGAPGFTYSGTNTTYIGSSTYSPNNFVGSMNEIVYYNVALTTTQRQQIEGYLALKWVLLRSLPATHPHKSIPPVLRPFTPIDVPGCAVWLDAADSTTVTLTPQSVTQWNDKSGNGRNAVANVAAVYSNTTSGSAVSFTGSNYYTFNNLSFAVGSYFTFFIVEKLQSGASYHILGTDAAGTNASPHIRYNFNGSSTTADSFRFAFYNNDLDATTGIPAFSSAATQPTRVWSLVFNNSFRGIYLNGTLLASDANNAQLVSWATPLLGRAFGGYYHNGFMYEILGYGGQIIATQRQQIDGYLAWKWGVQSDLPAGHPYVSAAPSGFTPTQISGCGLWLDAADATTLTLSGTSTVAQWNDKSGRGCNATKAAAGTITLSNNRIVFNGTSYLSLPSGTLPTGNSDYTFLTVGTTDRSSYQNIFFTGNYAAGQSIDAIYYPNGALESGWYTSNIVAPAGTISANQTTLVENVYSSPTLTAYVNGTSVASSSSLGTRNNPAGVTVLGGNLEGNQALIGTMCEFLVYSNGLTTTQRQQVEGYLAKKWGLLGNLPSGHPYYYTGPSAFTPTSLSRCVLWLDAAQETAADGALVNTIADRSSNAFTISALASNTVTVNRSYLAGLPVYRLTDRLSIPSFSWRAKFTVALVAQCDNANMLISMLEGGVYYAYVEHANWYLIHIPNVSGSTPDLVDAAYPYNSGTWAGDSKWTITIWQYDLGSSPPPYRLNGTPRATALQNGSLPQADTTAVRTLYINGNAIGNSGNCRIAELLLFNDSFTVSQLQQLEGYLAHKWGIRNRLPAPHPYQYSLPPMALGFTPVSLSNCALWLDAADRSTMTLSGSNVTQWNDKSGNGANLSNASSNPVYQSNQINGLPGLVFGGSNWLSGSYTYATQTTAFVVYTTTSTTNLGRLIDVNSNGYGNIGAPWVTPNGGDGFLWLGGSLLYTIRRPQTGTRLYGYVINGASSQIWRNGSQETATYDTTYGQAATANGTVIGIGGLGVNPNQYFIGSVGEIVLFKSILSTAQRQQVEGYLAWKWGLLNNLPGNHPYRLIKP